MRASVGSRLVPQHIRCSFLIATTRPFRLTFLWLNAHGFVSADVGKIAQLTGAVGIISFSVVSTVFTLTLLAIWGFLTFRLRQVTPDQPREHIENPYFVTCLKRRRISQDLRSSCSER
eukprot:s3178_g1.t1